MPVPDFSPGEVLTAAAMDLIGLWKITPTSVSGSGVTLTSNSITFAASTEIILDGVFTADFRNYLIMWDGQFSAGSAIFALQYRAASSTTATGYNSMFTSIAAGTLSGTNSLAQTSLRVGANDTNGFCSLEAKIFTPQVASLPTRSHSTFLRNNSVGAAEITFGAQTATTQFTGLRLSIGTGNMTGSMQIYGMRL